MSIPPFKPTALGEISSKVAVARATFARGALRSCESRKQALRQLIKLVDENEEALFECLKRDLGKSNFEGAVTEIGMVRNDCYETLEHLEDWMRPTPAERKGIERLDPAHIHHDPLGTVLIIGAWNYPIQLVFVPLIGAIAGGNTSVLKPSEVSPHTAALVAHLVPKYFADGIVEVVNGAVAETGKLLEEKFDHIFYTGSGVVGRIIAGAAAKTLTPVTLELGGKSPCIVDSACDLTIAARRIMWGRFVNAGQTCIAPDYLLVHRPIKDALVNKLREAREAFMGKDPKACVDYARIVNERHYDRVAALLKHGRVLIGGECDRSERFIAPTVLDNVDLKSSLMTDEIFGPLLPIVEFDAVNQAIDFVNARDKPLALYIFSNSKQFADTIIDQTTAGGVTVNDTLMHVSLSGLPFGGVGPSGCGCYHGKFSFDCFTHRKSVLRKPLAMEFANDLRYPPYTPGKLNILRRLLMRTSESRPWLRRAVFVAAASVAVFCVWHFALKRQFPWTF